MITDSSNEMQNESSVTNSADSELDIDENELESEQNEPDLAESERGNNSPATQPLVSENNRASTPVRRPRQEGDNNNTGPEVRHTLELNRKKNLILSNIP